MRRPFAIWRARFVIERMGEISQQLIMQCTAREDGMREMELAQFCGFAASEDAARVQGQYYKRWRGELTGPS